LPGLFGGRAFEEKFHRFAKILGSLLDRVALASDIQLRT
jgi:hypothetical protein